MTTSRRGEGGPSPGRGATGNEDVEERESEWVRNDDPGSWRDLDMRMWINPDE
jgi:hypothetical protein